MDEIAAKMNSQPPEAQQPARMHAGVSAPGVTNWQFYNGAAIDAMLKHTPLVDLEYLVLLTRYGGIVPPEQLVPRSAKITRDNVWRIRQWGARRPKFSLGVLVLSYPWLDKQHPDRLGAQMRRLLPILEAMLAEAKADAASCTVGVMMDYPCLPQHPRTASEQQRFKHSLKAINKWYFHKATFVLLCDLPPPDDGAAYANRRLHADRGWCVFERAASMVIKQPECLLCLSQYRGATDFGHGGSSTLDAASCCGQMITNREPPISPARFAEEMRLRVASGALAFTAGADMELVIAQYTAGFVSAFDDMGSNDSVVSVGFANLGWGDKEGAVALDALRYAAAHCTFPLGPLPIHVAHGNHFSDDMRSRLPGEDEAERGVGEFRGKFFAIS